MSARDAIYDHLVEHPMRRDLSLLGISTESVTALTAAGYRILAPGEVDRETVERCAEVAERFTDIQDAPEFIIAERIATAIRTLTDGGSH